MISSPFVEAPRRERTEAPRRERVVDDIVDLVLDGLIHPGRPTSERVIAEQLPAGPSRTPVREALALLVRDGMFDQVPQVGVRLRPVIPDEIDELITIRRPLEVLVVKRLALRHDGVDLSDAAAAAAQAEVAVGHHSMKEFSRGDLLFHCGLARAAKMRAAEVSLRSWISRLRVFGASRALDASNALNEIKIFTSLMHAIESHDPNGAEELMLTSLGLAEERLANEMPVAMMAPPAAAVGAT